MNCVRCSTLLMSEIYEGTAVDRCPSCRGTWLDDGELTKSAGESIFELPADELRAA